MAILGVELFSPLIGSTSGLQNPKFLFGILRRNAISFNLKREFADKKIEIIQDNNPTNEPAMVIEDIADLLLTEPTHQHCLM